MGSFFVTQKEERHFILSVRGGGKNFFSAKGLVEGGRVVNYWRRGYSLIISKACSGSTPNLLSPTNTGSSSLPGFTLGRRVAGLGYRLLKVGSTGIDSCAGPSR